MKRNESERRDTLSIACTILSRYKNEDTRAQRSSRAGIGGSVVITARVRRRGQARRRRFLLRWRRSRSFEQGYTPFSPVPFVDSLVRSLVASIVARIPGKHTAVKLPANFLGSLVHSRGRFFEGWRRSYFEVASMTPRFRDPVKTRWSWNGLLRMLEKPFLCVD